MRAILFDLDETLLDRAGSVQNYIKNQYLRHRVENIAYEVYRDRFIELDARGYADKQQLFETLVQEFALSISAEELLSDFRQRVWKNCTTFAGAVEVLTELRRRGYKLGIITNGSMAFQGVKLAESGLHSLVCILLLMSHLFLSRSRSKSQILLFL